jgi:tetratricopeptide (TPR) repeat protein
LHQHDELLARCDRILALDPEHAAAWLGRGNALQGLRRHNEAADAYGEALARDAALETGMTSEGGILSMLARYAEVLENCDAGAHPAAP